VTIKNWQSREASNVGYQDKPSKKHNTKN